MRYLLIILSFVSFVFSDLLKPDSATLTTIHVLFEWEQEPDAVEYNIQASNSISFNNLYINTNTENTVHIEKNAFDWGNNVYWRVRPVYDGGSMGDWIDTRYFMIGERILADLNVDIYNDELIEDGLVMYSQFAPYVASGVIDKYGNEIWNSDSENPDALFVNHINEFGQIYASFFNQGTQFNYDHDVIWTTPNGTPIDGHEVKQIPNGNYMAFTLDVTRLGSIPEGPWTPYFQDLGYAADGVTNEFPWLGLRLVEWDEETREEVWSWDPFDHFTMDDYDLYGGVWWSAYFNGFFDWLHSNAFHFDEEEGVIYVSHRHLSRITKIDYETGEVLWNMGLPAEYNTGGNNICTDLRFSFQHNIQLLDDGTLLFFDNGNISPLVNDDEYPTTRIRRIRVIDNNHCETVWQFDLPELMFGSGMGSVQLLNNENYSIYTFSNGGEEPGDGQCDLLEVTPDKEIIWKASAGNNESAWYRSYKIPSIHPNAFSVIADNYQSLESDNGETLDAIELAGGAVNFSITNHSGYDHVYKYKFRDINSDWFEEVESEISISAYQTESLSFESIGTNEDSTNIILSIWPTRHLYSRKDLEFSVISNSILGDMNGDQNLNVLDIILLVNMSLGNSEIDLNGDMNNDGMINILDIVLLVNLILNS